MDNPWANAWGDSNKETEPKPWTATHESHESETDIALPSWSTGAAVKWAEPSENQTSLWNNESQWEPKQSPYENIFNTSKSTLDESLQEQSVLEEITHDELEEASTHTEPIIETSTPRILAHEDSASPAVTPPDSPDAFGTFETGLGQPEDSQLDPWGPSASSKAWADAHEDTEPGEPVDEWEAAKLQKQKQDRHVPPELLASIIRQFEELAQDLWPEEPQSTSVPLRRLEDDDRMTPLVNRLIPSDLMLQQMPPFTKTFISKSVSDAIKLTRHVPFTHSSPMSQYLVSKGSTAWEASVKSKIDLSSDDFLPPGWKMVEKDNQETPPPNTKRKTTGGLLSFFGRRAATPPVTDSGPQPQSPTRQAPKSTSNTPRASVDLSKSPSIAASTPPRNTPPSSTSSTPAPPPPVSPPVIPELHAEQSSSAVSRFFGRFSKAKSSGRNSIALSSNDLEFLSDIVPSASDSVEDQLNSMSIFEPDLPFQSFKPPANGAITKPQDDFLSFFDAPTQIDKHRPVSSRPSSFVAPKTNTPPSIPNPPSTFRSNTLKRTFTPIMTNSPPSIPSLPPKLDSFGLPPPPRSQTPVPISPLADIMTPIPPPPPMPSVPTQSNLSTFDDDDFAEFHSQPAFSADQSSQSSFADSTFSSFSSDKGFGLSSTSNPPDSLDDIALSSLRTPSPPRPLSKSLPPPPVPKSPPIDHPPPQAPRTTVLNPPAPGLDMWTAAPILPAPLAPASGPQKNFSPFDDNLTSVTPSFTPLKPPASTVSLAPTNNISPSLRTKQTSQFNGSVKVAGGLSAQDLSFFESL